MGAICYLFHHASLSAYSGMAPLVYALGAEPLYYDIAWERLQHHSWRLGHLLRRTGQWWSGSEWFAPWPWYDERRLVKALPKNKPSIAHYVFADFTPPRLIDSIHRKGGRIVATFHVSARRAPRVLGRVRRLEEIDAVTLVSASQRDWFLERGVAEENLHVFLHGVVTSHFKPAILRQERDRLRLLLVGKTERDHACAAEIMRNMANHPVDLLVMTAPDHHHYYRNVPDVRLLPFADDQALLEQYQQADLLFMPLLDCTANNAVLEAMACGTPVMANRVGGIPEYVDPECNIVMENKSTDDWTDRIIELATDRTALEQRRPGVRAWAERFDWSLMAEPYRELFEELKGA